LIDKATKTMGTAPSFWGRYFTSAQTSGTVEYRHALENPILAARNIRVLPIARQTNHVGGTRATGYADGVANAADLVATFGADKLAQMPGVCIFLDVEGSGLSRLSADYYTGWVDGLGSAPEGITILPCVYGIPGDVVSWTALAKAIAHGVDCHGLWMAHPLLTTKEPVAWDDALVTPKPDPGARVLLWQYMFPRDGLMVDRDQVNPSLDANADLLQFLVLPSA
jgi:hypothetical protein